MHFSLDNRELYQPNKLLRQTSLLAFASRKETKEKRSLLVCAYVYRHTNKLLLFFFRSAKQPFQPSSAVRNYNSGLLRTT